MNESFNESLLHDFVDQDAISIYEHSCSAPMLLVLVRHVGCAFCRRTLDELAQSLGQITDCGYGVGIVHMNADDQTEEQLFTYGLEGLPRFYDPSRMLYQGLGVSRAPLRTLFRPKMIKEGIQASRRYGSSWPEADPLQLPGAFLIDQGHVIAGETVISPDDHPDFLSLLILSESLNGGQ